MHYYRSMVAQWVFRYHLLRAKPIKKYFAHANERTAPEQERTPAGACAGCLLTDSRCICQEKVVVAVRESVRRKEIAPEILVMLQRDPATTVAPLDVETVVGDASF